MKTFLLSFLVLTVVAAPLQAAEHDRPLKGLTGAFFALSVANLEESARWYREKLGLDVVLQVDQGTAVTVLEGEGLTVELIHDPAARPASGQPSGRAASRSHSGRFPPGMGSVRTRSCATTRAT